MSDEFEHGFGTGLRAQLQRKQEKGVALPVELPEAEVTSLIKRSAMPELGSVQSELEEALAREQQLREALQHEIEGHERELAAGRDLALREAEAEQLAAKAGALESDLEERERVLADRLDEVATERRDINMRRTELIAEEARLVELATHVEGRAADLDSADQERAAAAAELAKQLATIAERDRQLKRERASVDEHRGGAEARLAAREQALREHDEAVRVREQAASTHERQLEGEVGKLERERERLRERVEAIASREAEIAGRLTAREEELGDREAALGAWEERVRAQSERADRERAGHGRASQEAFSLMSELERREEALKLREAELARRSALRQVESPKQEARDQLLARGEDSLKTLRAQLDEREALAATAARELLARAEAIEQAEQDLRVRDARLGAELELKADKLDRLTDVLAERQRLLDERERDLAGYISEVQEHFIGGAVDAWPQPVASGRPAA
jgi:chromosome segregation ATPase